MGNQQSSAQSKQEGHVVVEKELEQDLIEVEVLRMSSMDSEVTLDSYNVVGSDSESEYDEDDANEEEGEIISTGENLCYYELPDDA